MFSSPVARMQLSRLGTCRSLAASARSPDIGKTWSPTQHTGGMSQRSLLWLTVRVISTFSAAVPTLTSAFGDCCLQENLTPIMHLSSEVIQLHAQDTCANTVM